jgi:hypothetical protein
LPKQKLIWTKSEIKTVRTLPLHVTKEAAKNNSGMMGRIKIKNIEILIANLYF